jgi:hypothetical protein
MTPVPRAPSKSLLELIPRRLKVTVVKQPETNTVVNHGS